MTGELLKQIEPKRGANQNIDAVDRTKVVTRKDAAEQAGMPLDHPRRLQFHLASCANARRYAAALGKVKCDEPDRVKLTRPNCAVSARKVAEPAVISWAERS